MFSNAPYGVSKNPLVYSVFCVTNNEGGDTPVPPTSSFMITETSIQMVTESGNKMLTE